MKFLLTLSLCAVAWAAHPLDQAVHPKNFTSHADELHRKLSLVAIDVAAATGMDGVWTDKLVVVLEKMKAEFADLQSKDDKASKASAASIAAAQKVISDQDDAKELTDAESVAHGKAMATIGALIKSIEGNEAFQDIDHDIITFGEWSSLTTFLQAAGVTLEPMADSKLYSTTDDSSADAKNFHAKCDDKGATITLVKGGNGRVAGGYTSVSWDSGSSRYKADAKGFLFGLRSNGAWFKVPQKNTNYAIYTRKDYGPTFGGGHNLHLSNGLKNSYSAQHTGYYDYASCEDKNSNACLLGTYNTWKEGALYGVFKAS